jgi:hypothetical protein
LPILGRETREEHSVRAEQTVSEMVVESLARQAQALSEETDRPFANAVAEVLKTPAGRKLAELVDGPHRHQKAAQWQAGLLADRDAQRPTHLREGGGSSYSWLERYVEWAEGKDGGREEYHAYLGEMFASLEG